MEFIDVNNLTNNDDEVKDPRTRKWQITINNPIKKGYTHEVIIEKLKELKCTYYCLSDEIGELGTPHTHIFLYRNNDIKFSRLKKLFEGGHFDFCKGTCIENRDYVFKEGKWLNDKKGETNDRNSHFEFGEIPIERKGKRSDLDDLYDMIAQGLSDSQIIALEPSFMTYIDKFEKVRQSILYDKFKDKWRDLEVVYVYGDTGIGKTREIMENYGYSNVYRVCDYLHPFDEYKGQDVIVFEEFRSDIKIGNMLKYLEGYPLDLPCRYANKCACYTKVYIVTNIPLYMQYPNVFKNEKVTFDAFIRRISKVRRYSKDGIFECSAQEAMKIVHIDDAVVSDSVFTHDDLVSSRQEFFEQMQMLI